MTPHPRFRVIAPKRCRKATAPEIVPTKPQARVLQHATLGECQLVAVCTLNDGAFAALVRLADGAEKTVVLDQKFWTSSVSNLRPNMFAPPPDAPKRRASRAKKKAEAVEIEGEPEPGSGTGRAGTRAGPGDRAA
jgi:hypothetical protein